MDRRQITVQHATHAISISLSFMFNIFTDQLECYPRFKRDPY